MYLGFVINYIVLSFLLKDYFNANKINKIILIYMFIISVLFGPRGSILLNVLLIVYFYIVNNGINPIKLIPIFIISILFLWIIDFDIINILYWINDKLHNINSYYLRKIISSIESGSLNLSNKDIYYEYAWELIKENNYLLPNGFGKFVHETGLLFPHNFFIGVYMIFGFMSIIMGIYLVRNLIIMKNM